MPQNVRITQLGGRKERPFPETLTPRGGVCLSPELTADLPELTLRLSQGTGSLPSRHLIMKCFYPRARGPVFTQDLHHLDAQSHREVLCWILFTCPFRSDLCLSTPPPGSGSLWAASTRSFTSGHQLGSASPPEVIPPCGASLSPGSETSFSSRSY